MASNERIMQNVQFNRGIVIAEYHASPEAKPPSKELIITYLRNVASAYDEDYGRPVVEEAKEELADNKNDQGKNEDTEETRKKKTRPIWQGPFFAVPAPAPNYALPHADPDAEEDEGIKLCDLVRDCFITHKVALRRPAFVLLSEPGVGNTSVLKYVADRFANGKKNESETKGEQSGQEGEDGPGQTLDLIPIYISLADLHPNQQFLGLVQAAFSRDAHHSITMDEAYMLLTKYRCLLLLDELEMVGNLGNAEGLLRTRHFIDCHPTTGFIISCRDSSYCGQLGQLETYRVARLSKGRIDKLLEIVGEKLDKGELENLYKYGRNRKMLEIYLGNPFRQGQKGGRQAGHDWLEEQTKKRECRAHLMHEMIEEVLDRKVVAGADDDEVQVNTETLEDILEQIGYQMHTDRTLRYPEDQLLELIRKHLESWGERRTTVRQVVRALKNTGIMQREEQRFWRFDMRPTQAYFAAAAMTRDSDKERIMLANISSYWWREPLEVFIGLTHDPNDLLFRILDRDPETAARCARHAGQSINMVTKNAVINALLERMKYAPSEVRAEIVKIMDHEFNVSAGILWYLLCHERNANVILVIASALARYPNRRPPDTRRYRTDTKDESTTPEDMRKVMEAWRDDNNPATGDKKRKENEQQLLEIYGKAIPTDPEQKDDPERVKGVAAIALGAVGSEVAHKEFIGTLMDLEKPDFVDWCVVDALTLCHGETIVSDAKRLYGGNMHQMTFAVYLLGWSGHLRDVNSETEAEILRMLKESLRNEEHSILRAFAAQSLGMLGLPEAEALLEERLDNRKEGNWKALRKTIKALGKVGSIGSLSVLAPYLQDESAVIRRRTRRAIAEIEGRFELA